MKTIVSQSKKLIEKVLSYIVTISDLSDVTLSQILEECGVTAEQCLRMHGKKGLYYISENHVK